MMEIRLFDYETHYPLYLNWCRELGVEAAPKAILPPRGFIVYGEKKGALCCGWANQSLGIGTFQIMFLTVNPKLGPMLRAKSLMYLIGEIEALMPIEEYTLGAVWTENLSLVEMLRQLGWTTVRHNQTLMMKDVK